MKPFLLDIWDDARERRMWPVAVLLLLALIAVPLLLLKPAPEAAPPEPVTSASSTNNGIPELRAGATSEGSSLTVFNPKDPFRPPSAALDATVNSVGSPSSSTGSSPSVGSKATFSRKLVAGGGPGKSNPTADGGNGRRAPGGGSAPAPSPQAPSGDKNGTPQKRTLTYAVDATLKGPYRTIRYRGLPRLATLPGDANPLLIYLGVDSTGNNAVFLVDSTLSVVAGEGTCIPSTDSCGTLRLEPGQNQVFMTATGQRYSLQIDQIREVSAAAATSSARRANRIAESRARGSAHSARRFAPPVIADLFTRNEP